ncbi:MAG: FliA/WhiG family RNA polymerase sigma factor [Candidatus Didemnitutus sp.]|nr:FliA/WhiG family RNA polymerase sigma factor [Candidatus Didemnitutus sp.]
MKNAVVTAHGTDAATPPPATAAWRAYAGTSGAVDEKELIVRFLPLVRNVVDRIKLTLPPHIDADDLYSVGVTGLLAAVRKYDPEQGNTFAGYAAMRIRGAVLDELRRMDWCPRRTRARARKMKESINTLEQRIGRTATEDEICAEMGISHSEYAKWLEESRPVTFIALDQHADGEESEGASLHELLADESDTTGRETLEKQELLEILTQRMAELPDIPRKILAMYYFENMRLAEIAAVFGLTESRICQIHSQTILGLRAFIGRARNR